MSPCEQIREILRLTFGERLSRRQVSAATGVPVTTVSDYIQRAGAAGVSWPLPAGLDDEGVERLLYPPAAPSQAARPAPDWGYVHRELRRKGVTLQLLWLEYRQAHPDGYGYSQFCNLYRAWARRVDVVMRQVHRAGEKLFVDFPGDKVPIYSRETGEVALDAELFVAVAGASSYLYAEAFPSRELPYWVTGHVHAFEFMGGCPQIVVCDNLRSGVTRAHRYEPEVNATFAEMAAHYGVAVIPARAYKPRDKAKAESGVLIAGRWIIARLRNRRFCGLGEANAAIAECAAEINARPFKKLDGSRASLFESLERPALRPLPARRHEFATWRQARVNIDYHIEADRHYYSVPCQLAGQQVDVRLSAATVEVFRVGKRVASHVRSADRHRHTTGEAHMPRSHREHASWTPSRIIEWAAKTGPATAGLVEAVIAARPHPEQGYRAALGIIRLARRYGPDRLEAACARALACGLILAGRGTVRGMAAAAGIARRRRRAGWFFASATWDPGELGIAVARLVVRYLVKEGGPLVTAVDGTFFGRRGRRVAGARWAYDGSAQGGKKIASGNTRVILALVAELPFCPSPAALPVLFRLWRGKGTASQVELAAEMTEVLAGAFPGREIHGTGDAAFPGEPLATGGTTWTARLPASAVIHGPEPPPAGKRGQPRKKGDRIGKCREAAEKADWTDVTVRIYGKEQQVQAAAWPGLWYGCFKSAPGLFVLMREKDSKKPYDLGLFTLGTELSPGQVIERYSWRWPVEPSSAAGKQVTGAGQACNRAGRAVQRTVPFAFPVQTLMIIWYAIACNPAAGMEQRPKPSPWYLSKDDMHRLPP